MDRKDELKKFKALNLASLAYLNRFSDLNFKYSGTDSTYFEHMNVLIEENYKQGNLTNLKKWFADFSEMPKETLDLSFDDYIKEKTGFEMNIHEEFEERISEILQRKRIRTNQEYREVETKVNYLSELEDADLKLIKELNELLHAYYKRKIKP